MLGTHRALNICWSNKWNKLVSDTSSNTSSIVMLLLLLLLSCFSHVRLCVTPETAAHQAPPSLGLSRQEVEWVAISFSNAWKWKVKVRSLSRVRLLATPWTAAHQAPASMGFSRQEYWSGVPSPSPSIVIGMNTLVLLTALRALCLFLHWRLKALMDVHY